MGVSCTRRVLFLGDQRGEHYAPTLLLGIGCVVNCKVRRSHLVPLIDANVLLGEILRELTSYFLDSLFRALF